MASKKINNSSIVNLDYFTRKTNKHNNVKEKQNISEPQNIVFFTIYSIVKSRIFFFDIWLTI